MTPTRQELEDELAAIYTCIKLYQDSLYSLNRRKSQIEMLLARMEDSKQLDLLDYV